MDSLRHPHKYISTCLTTIQVNCSSICLVVPSSSVILLQGLHGASIRQFESPRVYRRLVSLSHTASVYSFIWQLQRQRRRIRPKLPRR